ncbi:hypothetical protein LSCM1_01714 [Leishmania martiniquensis]|uniref:Pan3 C-terminal knob domain-containing protein n=1 Tax=Leishmania martiniquensis TaxID=1580590 RepID=A0A836H4X0_9TRYP|nr:hypothetical protein LSCM1_01714 [Leishmania martiniquensis]
MLGTGRHTFVSSTCGLHGPPLSHQGSSSNTRGPVSGEYHGMNPVTGSIPGVVNGAQMMSPTFPSPHSLYSPQHHMDVYRTNGSLSMAADPFPATPYTPVSSLFMSPSVRNSLTTPHSVRPRRPVTHVTSSKFSMYTTIYNLEPEPKPSVMMPKVRMQVYQTSARYTGKDILLRRLVNVPVKEEECVAVKEALRQYRHPNLVPLTNLFATEEFVMGSTDVIMEYRYISGAKSLQEAFFTEGRRATEGLLWSFTCQLVGLLRSFHETLIPLHGLHWSKIIYVETTGRFYFTGLGLTDLLEPHGTTVQQHILMKQDIQALGFILFQLASRNLNVKLETFANKQPLPGFSQSFWELIKTCLEGHADSAQLCHALGERMSMEVGHQEGHADFLMSQCQKEMHNGRVMRLLIKLSFALESPAEVHEYTSENQRYVLRLFNQFLFNQVDEQNRVNVDWGHVYHCLNKLDIGSDETIQLIGTDTSNTVLVVSYADLRTMLDSVFDRVQQVSQMTTDVDPQRYTMSPGSI